MAKDTKDISFEEALGDYTESYNGLRKAHSAEELQALGLVHPATLEKMSGYTETIVKSMRNNAMRRVKTEADDDIVRALGDLVEGYDAVLRKFAEATKRKPFAEIAEEAGKEAARRIASEISAEVGSAQGKKQTKIKG